MAEYGLLPEQNDLSLSFGRKACLKWGRSEWRSADYLAKLK